MEGKPSGTVADWPTGLAKRFVAQSIEPKTFPALSTPSQWLRRT